MKDVVLAMYILGDIVTTIFLIFFDGYRYNWWNWFFAVPIDFMLATIWPIYWLILRPFFS